MWTSTLTIHGRARFEKVFPSSRPNSTGAQKKGFNWKRTRHSHRRKQDETQKQLKQADLATLELAQVEGHIDLKYLDESGFCLWSPVSYSYMRRGEQKRLVHRGINKPPALFGVSVSHIADLGGIGLAVYF